ncbi:acetyl-CoA/propionyl-CoA carboxylase, biotin carboxylase, biotin carboxyl carrier protein [Candidatus Planktophila dulcis]|uniref:acetyl/propionyl/methylcrotonyl-CoA carboxylase subunit alpha n=1 Tax=Candidatus Planktophila dulcis TaxID=1884914 RepID=UPI000BACAFB7|nr:biotin carboxylase N-terminal domain-containing protein [Candidatus Planktophila dulcis]ASY21592.1 acetyl-CoA/propionyl-CoA carboxylase, biotin carboxylase, biotin carboxyl carrier protein [Candidatus Planktophila dulcis]
MKRVLIANRGEIALRVIRACKDHGLESVAMYSEEDRDALHAQSADFAYSLKGTVAKDTYLNIPKIIALAKESGADAVHPGYGFLSENAHFAQAVLDAGLIWIGPPPEAISALGDKVSARRIAAKAGAPLVAGTKDPVTGHEEVTAFAKEHGLPIAIKAAFGGGGRGLKVARTMEEIPELYASAVREAIAGFGRGECFVERYLDKPRHVETQVLVDKHGHAVVVSTRDCSLQRRHQKLVEEAPAPFLTDAQNEELYRSSKAIMKEAGYIGAGTCEFLVGLDGTISFLEVNTRLQVEHPVSEEVTGIDLVREQFRIAMGESLGFDDPVIRGHSIEFRINGEDPGRSFLPAPGRITAWNIPTGPGVRVDAGFRNGDVIGGNFDSLLAKLIVTGATRKEAIQRARRALAEFEVGGLATAIPFHRAIVEDPAYTEDFKIYTSYIENEFKNDIPAFESSAAEIQTHVAAEKLVAEVNGKRFEILVHAPEPVVKRHRAKQSSGGGSSGTGLSSPMQGTVVKIAVEEGQSVEAGDLIIVLEAMKMEQPLNAHKSGVIKNLKAVIGETVASGTVLCDIIEA